MSNHAYYFALFVTGVWVHMLQSDAHKDGAAAASAARPSVLVRRTSRFGVPMPVSSSHSFTAAMTHQPGQVTVGGPLAILPAPSSRLQPAAEYLLPAETTASNTDNQSAQVRTQCYRFWLLLDMS